MNIFDEKFGAAATSFTHAGVDAILLAQSILLIRINDSECKIFVPFLGRKRRLLTNDAECVVVLAEAKSRRICILDAKTTE